VAANVERFDLWIRNDFVSMNTQLELLYKQQNDKANVTGIGLDKIYEHNRNLSKRLRQALKKGHLISPECEARSVGTSIINMADGQTSFMQRLKKADIAFDQRLEGVRISPHIYNTEQDLDKLINCL